MQVEKVKITEIKEKGPTGKYVSIYVDGKFWKRVTKEFLISWGIKKEQEISTDELEQIGCFAENARAENHILRLLSFRGRSINEIKMRLGRAGFSEEAVESAVDKLKRQGYLNDRDFARIWIDERFNSKRYGRHKIKQELYQKGVEKEIIESELSRLSEADEKEHALQLARKKYNQDTTTDAAGLERRMYQFLIRRGFDSCLAKEVMGEVLAPEEKRLG
jgi:regulatory protein